MKYKFYKNQTPDDDINLVTFIIQETLCISSVYTLSVFPCIYCLTVIMQ